VVLKQTVTTHVACRIHQALSGADVQRLSRQLSRAQAQRIGEDVRRAAEAARAAGAAARH
jgi:hypothetical protein